MTGAPVLTEVTTEGIGILTFNRPEVHNAVSDEMREAIGVALDAFAADASVRCVLMRGEGKSFCAGRDTRQLGQRREGWTHHDYIGFSQSVRRKQVDLPKPLVAALRGHAIGGGAEMALAADMRIAADDLSFCLPEVKYGLALDTGGSAFLTQLAGPARAKWLMMSGEPIGAETALAWGIVDWTCPAADLDLRALELCRKLASVPPHAAAAQKALVNAMTDPELHAAMEREIVVQSQLFDGSEYQAIREARRKAAKS
jgi:enoyl-CoA hydratase